MKKKIFLFFLCLLFAVNHAFSQTDTVFWFVVPEIDQTACGDHSFFRFSTYSDPADITISKPANIAFNPIHLTIGANSSHTLDLSYMQNDLENKPAGTILNYGLLIQSTHLITCSYETCPTSVNPALYTLKGKNALGDTFFLPAQSTFPNGGTERRNLADIVATQDTTTVTIIPSNDMMGGHNKGIAFNIKLNKGQSYSARSVATNGTLNLHGTEIISDKPIAITLSDDYVAPPSTCADACGDQLVPIDVLGTEYIVVKGFLTPSDGSADRVYVLAIQDGTKIYVDGSPTPTATINKGKQYDFLLNNNSTYIKSDNPVYVLHLTGIGCEAGESIIPSIECTGSNKLAFTRSTAEPFYMIVTTRNGYQSTFVLNGNTNIIKAANFQVVPGTNNEWVAARTTDISTAIVMNGQGSILSNSNPSALFHCGIINGQSTGTGCRYGYYSNYNGMLKYNKLDTNVNICRGNSYKMNAGPDYNDYKWNTGDSLNSITVSPLNTTTYFVTVSNACTSTAQKVVINVDTLYLKLNKDTSICSGDTLQIKPNLIYADGKYTWSTLETIDSIIVHPEETTTYTVKSVKGACTDSAKIVITALKYPDDPWLNDTVLCPGQSGILHIRNSGNEVYYWYSDKLLKNLIDSGKTHPVANLSESDTFYIQSRAFDYNCFSKVMPVIAKLGKEPKAYFHAYPRTSFPNLAIEFTDSSVNAAHWHWYFGTGEGEDINQNPSYPYKHVGVFTVTLIVKSSDGCPDTATIKDYIEILKKPDVFIPSSFTPNGDYKNDVLLVRGQIKTMNLKIYNQWGLQVFESQKQGDGWDGNFKGVVQPEGNYIYVLKAVSVTGEDIILQGVISLIR